MAKRIYEEGRRVVYVREQIRGIRK